MASNDLFMRRILIIKDKVTLELKNMANMTFSQIATNDFVTRECNWQHELPDSDAPERTRRRYVCGSAARSVHTESNRETSDKPKPMRILANDWPVLFKDVSTMKNKDSETISKERG